MSGSKPFSLKISLTQSTNGEIDNQTVSEEFSSDPVTHAIKTQVFAEEMSKCLSNITKRLTDLAIEANTPSKGR